MHNHPPSASWPQGRQAPCALCRWPKTASAAAASVSSAADSSGAGPLPSGSAPSDLSQQWAHPLPAFKEHLSLSHCDALQCRHVIAKLLTVVLPDIFPCCFSDKCLATDTRCATIPGACYGRTSSGTSFLGAACATDSAIKVTLLLMRAK